MSRSNAWDYTRPQPWPCLVFYATGTPNCNCWLSCGCMEPSLIEAGGIRVRWDGVGGGGSCDLSCDLFI